MKIYKRTGILILIAVFLAVLYFISSKKNETESNLSEENKINIIKLNSNSITEIDIDNKIDNLIFKRLANNWELIKPSDIKYDQAVADGLPLSIFYATASKEISKNSQDLGQYGLKNPSKITLKTNDSREKVLEIGNLNSTNDSYYVKLKDSNEIYIMDKNKINSILLTKNAVKDKNILSLKRQLKSKMVAEDISEVTLEKNNTLIFSAKKDISIGDWTIISPIQVKAEKKEIIPVLDAISRVLALEFIDDNPNNFSKYGLENPMYSLEFKNSTGVKKLYIGNEKEINSEYYARVEGSNDVFSINEQGFNFLDKPLKEFIQK